MIDLIKLKKGTEEWYEKAFSLLTYDKGFTTSIKKAASRVAAGKTRYEPVAAALGMHWWHIGALHNMEASCNFSGVLHNGERIIGTTKKTTLVPKGRGPFKTWEDAAIDALGMKRYARFGIEAWTLGFILQKSEEYNGVGYLKWHPSENSPYLWAQTNINDDFGKYTSDGKFSETASANGQTGIAAIFKELEAQKIIKIPKAF